MERRDWALLTRRGIERCAEDDGEDYHWKWPPVVIGMKGLGANTVGIHLGVTELCSDT